MEKEILADHVILITEWDFERKIKIVITETHVWVYLDQQLITVKPVAAFFQELLTMD